jgi:aspartyl-tRNA(Asn)/glutamyl-tRNA(Gln) amidotransferase subunit A
VAVVTAGNAVTISAARDALRAGQLSSRELVEQVLRRAEATQPLVAAYAHLDATSALQAAAQADDELRTGRDRGPLHGIPVGAKDVFLTRDMPTRAGSRLLDSLNLQGEATAVSLLRRAGAVLLGKHVTHELACGQDVPPTRNPWRLSHYPGGSSAGGAASVAVGSSLAALGTDAGGSVRKPAALTGVVGLKPTFGRISRLGVVPPSGSMDHVGILARTVEDAAIVLQALSGHLSDDDSTFPIPVEDYVAAATQARGNFTIGRLTSAFAEATPEIAQLIDEALSHLAIAGVRVVDVSIESIKYAAAAAALLLAAEAGAAHLSWLRSSPQSYGAATRRYLLAGAQIPGPAVLAATRTRMQFRRDIRRTFEAGGISVLATPTTPITAMALDEMDPRRDLSRYTRNTVLANLAGLPAISLPCGFVDGLPVGLQLIGRPFMEAQMISIAATVERSLAMIHTFPL